MRQNRVRSFVFKDRGLDIPNPQNPFTTRKENVPRLPNLTQITPITPLKSNSSTSSKRNILLNNNLPMSNECVSPMQSRPIHPFGQFSDRYLRFESVLESFLLNCATAPLSEAIESTIRITLNCSDVILWQDIPNIHLLYSARLEKTCPHSYGLVGECFFTREVIITQDPYSHPSYQEDLDGPIVKNQTCIALFPLWDQNNNLCAIVELARNGINSELTEEDQEFIQFFIKKFKVYSQWLFQAQYPHEHCLELLQLMEVEQFLLLFKRKMISVFKCRTAEIWKYNSSTHELYQYSRTCTKIDIEKAGIVGEALNHESPINCVVNKLQSSYLESMDGSESEPVLITPLYDLKTNTKYAICIRGHKGLPIFTPDDERLIRQIAPYIILALDNNIKYVQSGTSGNRIQSEHLAFDSLCKLVDELTSGAPFPKVLETTIENVEMIVNAERGYLFDLDRRSKMLTTEVATNCKIKPPQITPSKGIVGKTMNEKKVFNIPDAYEDIDFDSTFDLYTNYKTTSLVSVPVINNRQKAIAVAQFLNKKDGKPFSNNDIKIINLFSCFLGLYMENDKMAQESSENSSQLRSLVNVSLSLTTTTNLKVILNEIMNNARNVIQAERASLFILDEVVGALTCILNDGGQMPQTIPLSHGIAATAAKTKECIVVNDAYHDPRFNKTIDYHTKFKTKSLAAAPLISSEGQVIGVAEMVNKQEPFTEDDINLLKSFAIFASISIETRRLKDISSKGSSEVEMMKWIGEFEKKSYVVPTKLQIPIQKQSDILSLNFFCIDWNGIGLYKVAFYIFSQFQLLERFHITNELFFTFLYRLSSTYNQPPYHNWIHAIDVLQYFAYQIKKAAIDNVFTGLELLAICVAALGHDAGHQGFNNVYNINAQTPLGILFKDQSVMETYHCTVLIRVLQKEESNIFVNLTPNDLKKIWNWIIQMILATDMALHFKLVKNANDIMDQGPINLANESHRVMAMTMLMKVADISNVSRPFDYANKWCDVLSEEFWRQGDAENEQGLNISSPLNDRKNKNKAEGQVGFYNFICIPLYQAIARIFPELEVNALAVKENLEKWKAIAAENETPKQVA